MTHDEFWTKVRAAGPWAPQRANGNWMRNPACLCPLQVGCGKLDSGLLPSDVGINILNAADFADHPYRPLLLRELGLA